MKHCPICDRASDRFRFYGEICEVCAGKKLAEKLPKEVSVVVCRDCGRMRVSGSFEEPSQENMQRLLAAAIRQYSVRLLAATDDMVRVAVTDEKTGGLTVEHDIKLLFGRTLCEKDSRRRAGYYEAVVQFRGDEGKVSRTAASLQKFVERNNGFITRTEQKEHGMDIFVSDKKLARAFIMARRLSFKSSFKLQGERHGKRLYRNTYFVTLGRRGDK